MVPPIVEKIIRSHGGAGLWRGLQAVEAEISAGGFLFRAKQRPLLDHVRVRAGTGRPRFTFYDFPSPGLLGELIGDDEVCITGPGGSVIEARKEPRRYFRGLRRLLYWDDLDFIYFGGYATWNYLVSPFIFLQKGFHITEGKPPRSLPSGWTMLNVTFPDVIPTHCRDQIFYFDEQLLLRRLDYTAEVVGSWARAAHLCDAYRDFEGLRAPTQRRVLPLPFGSKPLPGPVLVSIKVHDMRLISA